jgi:hypothetical protein
MIRKAKRTLTSALHLMLGVQGAQEILSVEELQTAASSLGSERGSTWGIQRVTEQVAAARGKSLKRGIKATGV